MYHQGEIASHIASWRAVSSELLKKLSTILKSGRFRLELLSVAALFLTVFGAVLINYKMPICFTILTIGNVISAWIHFQTKLWTLVIRDLIFLAIAIQGWILWH